MSGIKITPSGSGLLLAASRSRSGFVCEVEEEKLPAHPRCQGAKHRPGRVRRRCHQVPRLKPAALHLSSRCLPYVRSHMCKISSKNIKLSVCGNRGHPAASRGLGVHHLVSAGLGKEGELLLLTATLGSVVEQQMCLQRNVRQLLEVGGGRLSFHLHLGHR